MDNIETDSDADSFDDDSDNPDDWCFGCGCNISGTTNFIFCEENDSFYCIECYEKEVWIE